MSAEIAVQQPRSERETDYRRVVLLSLGHLTNDLYGNLLTSLTPYLVIRGTISTSVAGSVLLVYLLGSSVLQPLFGAYSDRTGRRFLAVFGPVWVACTASFTGWANSGLTLLALATAAGIGTAAFHPQAASMVAQLSQRSRGWVMSIFSTGGNVGFALGPVLAAGIATIGLRYGPLAAIPALGVTVLLARFAPSAVPPAGTAVVRATRPARTGPRLAAVVSIIALRSSVQYGLILFLPLYFHAHGSSAQLGSLYAFVLSLAGAAGGLAGGRISDRYGRRKVVVASLLLSVPLLYLSLTVSGVLVWPLLMLSGGVLLASNSVTVVQGQELLPGSTGVASGLTMGLGFGLSGVIGFVLGILADHIGVDHVIFLVPLLAPPAALLGWLTPDRHVTRTASAQ